VYLRRALRHSETEGEEMMLYISGAVFWLAAWTMVSIPGQDTGWHIMGAALCSWIGLVHWELAMRENRKVK